MAKNPTKRSASESIIILQSILLFCFGLAAWSASSVIVSGLDVMTNVDNMVTFRTEDALITDKGNINTSTAKSIVSNFELICFSSMSISSVILLATIYRIKKVK